MSGTEGLFKYQRRVAYADTDAMGIVHHSNYLRYVEEARVAWMHEKKLMHHHAPYADIALAVIDARLKYMKFIRFDDVVDIFVQVRVEGLKIEFAYAIFCPKRWNDQCVMTGTTIHIPVDSKMQIVRVQRELKAILEKEKWNETLLSNLSE